MGRFSLIPFPKGGSASMALRQLKSEEIADWLTPGEAADILAQVYQDRFLAKKTLLGRLVGGMVTAVSGHTVIVDVGHPARATLIVIPSNEWEGILPIDNFWVTGDLIYHRRSQSSSYEDATTSHYGVKFEPQGVYGIIKGAKSATPAATAAVSEQDAEEKKKPPVPAAHLAAWFEFYKKVAGEMRDDPALTHARMCFPNHSVTRQKIRDLLPERPMGRPRKDET
jgi:hypothetical protein